VTWNPGGGGSKLEAQASLEEISKNVGTAIAGHSVGTLAGALTLLLENNSRINLSAATLEVPEFAE